MRGSPWTKRRTNTPASSTYPGARASQAHSHTAVGVQRDCTSTHGLHKCAVLACKAGTLWGLERAWLAADRHTSSSSGTGHPSDASRTQPHSIPTAHRHPQHARAYRTGPSWAKHQARAQTANGSSKHLLQKHPDCAQHKHLSTDTLTRDLQVHGSAPCSHTTQLPLSLAMPEPIRGVSVHATDWYLHLLT